MNTVEYKKIVKKYTKKNKDFHNYIVSFLSGGLLGLLSQLSYLIIKNITSFNSLNIKLCISLFIILLSSFLTALGVFDSLIKKFRSGLIIPTTGFAHSVTSSIIDYKKEGYIKGMGGNCFHLAGSVILYSIVFSFILVILKVIFLA